MSMSITFFEKNEAALDTLGAKSSKRRNKIDYGVKLVNQIRSPLFQLLSKAQQKALVQKVTQIKHWLANELRNKCLPVAA